MTKSFPFLRLPQEVRDLIYDFVGGQNVAFKLELPSRIVQKDIQRDGTILFKVYTAQALGMPRANVMLVSRKVGKEYADENSRGTTLRLNASHGNNGPRYRLVGPDDKINKRFGRIAHLEIAYSLGHRVPGMPQDIDAIEGRGLAFAMIGCMGSLRSIEVHRHLDITPFFNATDLPLEQIKAGLQPYCDQSPIMTRKPNSHSITISLRNRLFFHCPLAMVLKSYQPTPADKQKYPLVLQSFGGWRGVANVLDGLSSNLAMYEAEQTEDEESWFGLKLELVARAKSYDVEASLREMEAFEERVARWNDSSGENDDVADEQTE